MSRYIHDRGIDQLDHVVHLRVGQPRGYSRLNPAPEETRRFFLSELKEADLVVRNKTAAAIYEFTVHRPQNKLSQLLLYHQLLPDTPGYMDLDYTNIYLKLVSALEDSDIRKLAQGMSIDYVVFPDPEVLRKIAVRRGGS